MSFFQVPLQRMYVTPSVSGAEWTQQQLLKMRAYTDKYFFERRFVSRGKRHDKLAR